MKKPIEELIKVIDEMVAITNWDNSEWSTSLVKCKYDLENSDYHGIERLLGCYGGMGSFKVMMKRALLNGEKMPKRKMRGFLI